MDLMVLSESTLHQDVPLLALFVWEDEPLPPPIADLLEDGDFAGRVKQTQLLYPRGALPTRRVLLVGIGKRAHASLDRLREAGALAAQRALDLKLDRFAADLPAADSLAPAAVAQALAEGALLGSYRFQQYKTDVSPEDQQGLAGLAFGVADDAAAAGATAGAAIARGQMLARTLANTPSNDLPPAKLADAAVAVAEQFGMRTTVLGMAELQEQGFGGIVGVGKGSANEPRFVAVEHGQKQAGTPTICLVGKGITFDTGGISIKPADGMENMKMDMGGAAAVIGALHAVGELKLNLHVVGLIAAAENMPSATAYKPGDILKTLSGKTIEVLNTDAEGRIVLADALHYAQRYEPDAIVDLATLTGAIMVALGPHAIGVMSNNDQLAQRIARAGDESGERAWQLPLWEPYHEMVKSDIADVKNTAGRYGGAITAAAFLAAFAGERPWAHLDIAGTAWIDAKPKAYQSKGATGIGVRLLVQMLRTWGESA
jgi:leucyl aminopeptidase